MEPIVTTRWTQLKSVALRFQPAWKVASWCIRTGLVLAVGVLYLTRQAIYGTVNFLMPSDRFDRTVTSVSGAVSGFVDDALDNIETTDDGEERVVNMWNIGYDEYVRDPVAWEARWGD